SRCHGPQGVSQRSGGGGATVYFGSGRERYQRIEVRTLSQIGEARILHEIARILKTNDPAVLCGAGDDAAVLQLGNKKILFTIDALLEAVHFDWNTTSPYLLGRKSLSVNLSDVAAMGGRPRWALVSLALPSRARMDTLREFYRGLKDCSRKFGVEIV